MKKLLLLITVISVCSVTAKNHPSKVKSVTVYQTRAEITRAASLDLTAGEQELVFAGVSTMIDANNIQVKGTGNLTILGTSFRRNYLNENELPANLQKIKDQLEALEYENKKHTISIESLNTEKSLLEKNMSMTSQGTLTSEELDALAVFYRKRIRFIETEKLEIEQKKLANSEELRKLLAQYRDGTANFQKNSGEIVVNVDVKSATKANLELVYIVSSAGWRAEYDIRSEDVNEPLELNYKAIITQNTGENWKDVKLILSTGNPNAGIIKPELNPQYLNIYEPRFYKSQGAPGGSSNVRIRGMANDMRQAAPMALEEVAEPEIDDISVASETKTMYTNYEVERPYSLNSGDKPLNVTIRQQSVEADYEYQSVPKLRPRVFLIAKAKNWGELVLLPGPINIFFEGGYVGKSYMDPNVTTDNLPISLGYDPGISIERKKLTDKSSKRTIGANQRETLVYEITVRNNKSKDIKVVVQDQIPVSQHSDIKVENVSHDGSLDAITGELKWTINLKSGEKQQQEFSYDIRYPKGRNISGL